MQTSSIVCKYNRGKHWQKKMCTISKTVGISNIIVKYKDQPSVKYINNLHSDKSFSMHLAKKRNIQRISTNYNAKKASGSDLIPPKIVLDRQNTYVNH